MVPNPAIRTDSSLARDSPIASNTVSTAASASALPSFSLTANRRADQAGDDAGAGACRDADADRAMSCIALKRSTEPTSAAPTG